MNVILADIQKELNTTSQHCSLIPIRHKYPVDC